MDDLIARVDRVSPEPNRAAGLARLKAFQGRMGSVYARQRNHDFGPDDRSNVSALSPWVRQRLLLEQELVRAALDRFALSTAEKFIQEVCWRTYFKGWLEHRPEVWNAYRAGRDAALARLETEPGLRETYEKAIAGDAGIEGLDDWARELVATGYLHNHARMWFASIWIYTLRLPWALGADFFLTHLMDGDAASNTCSWRWVGGLHTRGKTYLARRSNMERYSGGRFSPAGLATEATPLEGGIPAPGRLRTGDAPPQGRAALLLTEEDLHVETLWPAGLPIEALAGVSYAGGRSPAGAGTKAAGFVSGAVDDALRRGSHALAPARTERLQPADVEAWCRQVGCATILTGFPPVGWVRDTLDPLRERLSEAGIRLVYLQRDWDAVFWPHARKGFFALKKAIPDCLGQLGLAG